MNTKGVIFDMDGVIADTQKIHARIESALLAEAGIVISPEEISRRFSGMGMHQQCGILFDERGLPHTDFDAIAERAVAEFQACAHEYKGIPGTLAVIESLFGRLPLAVASGSRNSSIELVLKTLGIRNRFQAVASSKEVLRGKPAPDVFLLAAERLAVLPEDCIVVEDGVSGMIGAKAAGMRCIALSENLWDKMPADIVVRDLREVASEYFT